jgi:hypothetical protein
MSIARPAALIVALATLATSAIAATPPQYSQLRDTYPQINDAIAAATESDLHGTFNRLSALFNRAPIDGAAADAGFNGQLPANFERNLEATLLDLQEDLGKDQLGGLTVAQKTNILQVVRIYAFRRVIELWQSEPFTTCSLCPIGAPEDDPCCCCVDNDPAVLNEVQDTVSASRTLYTAGYNSLAPADRAGLPAPSALDADNFIGSIEQLAGLIGVESIDS